MDQFAFKSKLQAFSPELLLEQIRRMEKLIAASQSLARVEEADDLVAELLAMAEEVTRAEASSFLVYRPEEEVLRFWLTRDPHDPLKSQDTHKGGFTGEVLKHEIELKLGEGLAGWSAAHRCPLVVADVAKDPRFSHKADDATGFVTRSVLCVPVVYMDELLGVIQVLNAKGREAFDDQDAHILESFAALAAVSVVRARLLQDRTRQARLDAQMDTAAKLQSHFWPQIPELGHGSHAWGVCRPASLVGGDLYDIIDLGDGSYLLFVADVSGKGLPAALVVSALWSTVRGNARAECSPAEFLCRVNAQLFNFLTKETFFATMQLIRYWPATGRLVATAAGHHPPVRLGPGGFLPFPVIKALPLGILEACDYPQAELTLAPGEGLVLYTDGVNEAMDPRRKLFGEQRLADTLALAGERPHGPFLLDALDDFRQGREPSDDITILELWRDP